MFNEGSISVSTFRILFSFLAFFFSPLSAHIKVGADVFVHEKNYREQFKDKRIGLITNQSAINADLISTVDLLSEKGFKVHALFAPEHGFYGDAYAYDKIKDSVFKGIPVYSLHGTHRRPSKEMLEEIDVLVYDIQDIGTRSYTYLSTLFYCMEAAQEKKIPFVVLDRPNPMGGLVCDGPSIDPELRSFLGYVEVPYCHGMTIAELAMLFREEYSINIHLTVVPMNGWKRGQLFEETGLKWIPTSPQIPESDTPFFYPTTGIIGHCSLTNIGIGYTLPFKIIGTPWIDPEKLADALNAQKLPGVSFRPFYFRPFFGKHKLENCKGVRIFIEDPAVYLPVTTQFVIMGILKSLYPKQFEEGFQKMTTNRSKKEVFLKLVGRKEILELIANEKFFSWKLREIVQKDRRAFEKKRAKYLIKEYMAE